MNRLSVKKECCRSGYPVATLNHRALRNGGGYGRRSTNTKPVDSVPGTRRNQLTDYWMIDRAGLTFARRRRRSCGAYQWCVYVQRKKETNTICRTLTLAVFMYSPRSANKGNKKAPTQTHKELLLFPNQLPGTVQNCHYYITQLGTRSLALGKVVCALWHEIQIQQILHIALIVLRFVVIMTCHLTSSRLISFTDIGIELFSFSLFTVATEIKITYIAAVSVRSFSPPPPAYIASEIVIIGLEAY